MSAKINPKLRYTKSHEWVEILPADEVRVGITDHAQESLGDITYFELPAVGKTFTQGQVLGFVESVKAVSDIYAPVGLEVIQVNAALDQKPEVVNQSPYDQGWYIKARVKDKNQLEELLSAKAYEEYLSAESH